MLRRTTSLADDETRCTNHHTRRPLHAGTAGSSGDGGPCSSAQTTPTTPHAAIRRFSSSAAGRHRHQQPGADDSPNTTSSHSGAQTVASVDKKEIAKFAALADRWWDHTSGPFAPLHALNAARCLFIRRSLVSSLDLDPLGGEPLAGLRVLDVGCGGGLLSEPLARMGAQVTGIDLSPESVGAAAAHAAADPLVAARVTYRCAPAEALAASEAGAFDVVVSSEVIEHVRAPADFVKTLAALAAPGGRGRVVVSTLNRTPQAYALAIVGAEYLTGLVPKGTHDWTKFITPQELAMMSSDAGLELEQIAGMVLDPLAAVRGGGSSGSGSGGGSSGRFVLSEDLVVNYIALMKRADGDA
jgi:polyprenyldihydroxybenzoate methyltransferase/3-demethylubiquinol 3-O-methyltransferase